jgi:hypothetical protein
MHLQDEGSPVASVVSKTMAKLKRQKTRADEREDESWELKKKADIAEKRERRAVTWRGENKCAQRQPGEDRNHPEFVSCAGGPGSGREVAKTAAMWNGIRARRWSIKSIGR